MDDIMFHMKSHMYIYKSGKSLTLKNLNTIKSDYKGIASNLPQVINEARYKTELKPYAEAALRNENLYAQLRLVNNVNFAKLAYNRIDKKYFDETLSKFLSTLEETNLEFDLTPYDKVSNVEKNKNMKFAMYEDRWQRKFDDGTKPVSEIVQQS